MSDARKPGVRHVASADSSRDWGTIELSYCSSELIRETSAAPIRSLEDNPDASHAFLDEWLRSDDHVFARYLFDNVNPQPLLRSLRAVARRWNAFALREEPYLDLEFWDSHAGFYDKCFLPPVRASQRFHFFSAESLWPNAACSTGHAAKEAQLAQNLIDLFKQGLTWEDIRDQANDESGKVHCHGYIILRPTLSFCVGRCAIQFDERSHKDLSRAYEGDLEAVAEHYGLISEEYEGRPFLKARHNCASHILGATVVPAGPTVEFMQQDPNLGPCATASLWVATHTTAESLGLNKFDYQTITRQALGGWSRERQVASIYDPTTLDTGLYPSEIQNAIGQTGGRALQFAPMPRSLERNHDADSDEDALARAHLLRESLRLRQEVYSFVESGNPVILCLGLDPRGNEDEGHAVVLIGHNLPAYSAIKDEYRQPANAAYPRTPEDHDVFSANHYFVSTHIPVFYSHDDRYGPFNRVTFAADGLGRHGNPKTQRFPCVRVGGRESVDMYVQQLIVPVSPLVTVGSSERLATICSFFDHKYRKDLIEVYGNNVAFLWRPLLVEGAEFKASLRRRSFSEEITQWYLQMMLPKYIWLFEVSLAHDEETWISAFNREVAAPREIIGEAIVDPTTSYHNHRCLAMRILDEAYDYREPAKSAGGLQSEPDREFGFDENALLYSCFAPASAGAPEWQSDGQ